LELLWLTLKELAKKLKSKEFLKLS